MSKVGSFTVHTVDITHTYIVIEHMMDQDMFRNAFVSNMAVAIFSKILSVYQLSKTHMLCNEGKLQYVAFLLSHF